jgi:uncharacterized protein (TIGR02145 family)
MTKHRPTIILMLCAVAMVAMYCVQFEFNNPVDPANSGRNPPPVTYTLTVNRNLTAGGTVTPASAQSGIIAGVPVDITATPASGYTFVNWTAESGTATFGNSDNANTTVTLSSNATIRANFQLIPTYTLTVSRDPTAGGTVTPASAQSGVIAGVPVDITATPASGYTFVNWTVTNGTAAFEDADNANTTITLSSNATIRANFAREPDWQFNPNITYGSFEDPRDRQIYRTVRIGTQTWMAENLNLDVPGSVCYDDEPSNCEIYGRFYDWATVMGFSSTCNSNICTDRVQSPHRGICPAGWHVPSNADWETLIRHVDPNAATMWGDNVAGTILKSRSGWNDDGYGTNDFGFSALPSGAGSVGIWWSASAYAATYARYWSVGSNSSGVYQNNSNKPNQLTARCLQEAGGCTQWSGWVTTTAPTCTALGMQTNTCIAGTGAPQTQLIPQLLPTDPACQTTPTCNPPMVTIGGVCQSCPAGQVPNATHTGCVTQGSPPTGTFCYLPPTAANLIPACWPIGGTLCIPGENCTEMECRESIGMVILDCNNPPVVEYCNWGLTAGEECHIVPPGMYDQNPQVTNREACQAFAFISIFPDCRDFIPPQHFCRWPVPTGCVPITNPHGMSDNPPLTNLELCYEYGRYFTSMEACESFVPTSQVRDFGLCEGGSGWNCTAGGCYAGGTDAQMTECAGATWCTIRDRCPVGHCPPEAIRLGQPHCM